MTEAQETDTKTGIVRHTFLRMILLRWWPLAMVHRNPLCDNILLPIINITFHYCSATTHLHMHS